MMAVSFSQWFAWLVQVAEEAMQEQEEGEGAEQGEGEPWLLVEGSVWRKGSITFDSTHSFYSSHSASQHEL